MMWNLRLASIRLIIGIGLSCVAFSNVFGNTPGPIDLQFNHFMLTSAVGAQTLEERSALALSEEPLKSSNRAFLSSLAVPGTGQLYVGKKYGFAMLAADIALLTAWFVVRNDAEDTREAYRQEVRDHVIFDGPGSFDSWDEIEDFEHATLYDNWHNVYTDNNGEPLERVGKWYWDDRSAFKDDDREGKDDSPNRIVALELREDANDNFQLARTFLGFAILNHITSAIEARIASKRYNSQILEEANLPKPVELDVETVVRADSVKSQLVLRTRF